MKNVFNVRSETLDLAVYKSYKFQGSRKCTLGCEQDEDIKHIMNCKKEPIEEDKKLKEEDIEDLKNVISVNLKININKLSNIICRRNMIKENKLIDPGPGQNLQQYK